ncbi:ommochrome-binding protein-like [Aphomia sociella]
MFNYIYSVILIVLISVKVQMEVYTIETPVERIGGRFYKKELLTNQFTAPKELSYDSASRNLFFMYMDDVIQNSGRAAINVVTKETIKIKGIERNKATAVDPDTGDVYFGSDNGLYKYDPIDKKAFNIGLYNVNIMKIIIRNNEMYIIDANNHKLYKVYNEGTRTVAFGNYKTVMNFEVDSFRNVHFVTMCGLFCSNDGNVVKNKDLPSAYHLIVGEDKTYAVYNDALYNIDCWNGTAEKVADLNFDPRSITFGDYGDVFYTEDDNIFMLKPIRAYVLYRKKT